MSELSRYLVLFSDDAADEGAQTMADVAGLRTVRADAESGISIAGASDGVFWHDLGFAVVTAATDQYDTLRGLTSTPGPIALVEPSRRVHALSSAATGDVTWGLDAIGATTGSATGAGVRVAVLDTGFATAHPDFAGRTIVTRSFFAGSSAEDGHGHGTHVIGTACGPRQPATGPGYGVAHESEIYAGKVLNDDGEGSDGEILAGLAWAVDNGCAVVSLSLGAAVEAGQSYSRTFERAARRALQKGTMVVAAAGNDSNRADGLIAAVGHPANCPSIMAVGAVDKNSAIAPFSAGTVDDSGAVDIVAPGMDVHSSWPAPENHAVLSGTSMATPHVAGVAALLAQQHGAGPWELWTRLTQSARRLPLPSTDVGAGLVQAPT